MKLKRYLLSNTYLCRFTALLNYLLEPGSIRHCKYKINDYYKNLKSYLEHFKIWKTSFTSKDSIWSTVDIVNLYLSLYVPLVTKSFVEALNSCSEYDENPNNNLWSCVNLHLTKSFYVSRKFIQAKTWIHNRWQQLGHFFL